MNVLILSCHTGDGHNSAALAIAEALTAQGAQWGLADPVAFKSERARRFVAGFYTGMVRKVPLAFGALYKVGRIYSNTGVTSPVYYANATYAGRLYDYIREQGFDAVISTHLYGMEAMTAVRFVPAHAEATEDIAPLARFNREKVLEIAGRIVDICAQPLNFETILQRLFAAYGITMDFQQYALVGSTVRSYLAWLKDSGRLTVRFEDNKLLWERA